MADRRTSTIPKKSEEEKKIQKKAEAMLAKSENNWNKITPEQKELLNSPTTAHFFSISSEDCLSILNKKTGVGIEEVMNKRQIEFQKGKLFVNAADPNHLSWAVTNKMDEGKSNIQKINLLKLSQHFCGSRDLIQKDGKRLFTLNTQPLELESYDRQYEIMNVNGDPNDFCILELHDAYRFLQLIGQVQESIDSKNLIMIRNEDIILFILLRNPKITHEWLVALKILLKAQNLSYRGTKDEYPNKKKDFIKEMQKDKDLRLEYRDKKILLWILDLETDSLLYRELKIYFWSRAKEFFIFLIIDMRKTMDSFKEVITDVMKNESYLCKKSIKSYLLDVEVSRFFLIMQEDYDIITELKNMSFLKDQKDKFMNVDHVDFWNTRRRIRKRYQNLIQLDDWVKMKEREKQERKELRENKYLKKKKNKKRNQNLKKSKPTVEERFDIDCKKVVAVYEKVRSSLDEVKNLLDPKENAVLNALKVVQLQKQVIRSRLMRISAIRDNKLNPYRRKKCGSAMKIKEVKNHERAAKKAYTAASNVLKIMMFEDTIPGMIPEQIRHTINQEDKQRDGCCSIF